VSVLYEAGRYALCMLVRVVCAAALVLGLATGCGGEEEGPEPLPPLAASQSPSVAASAVAVPSQAVAQTPEAAAEFARFFYAEVERAYREKDPTVVERLSAPGCSACERFVDSLTKLRDDGESVTPVVYEIIAAEAPAFEGGEARVDVIYNSPAITRRDRSGAVISTEPEVEAFEEQVTLVRTPNGWRVKSVKAV